MLSKALLVIGILGDIWLITGLAISVRYRSLGLNLPRLILCVAVVFFAFLASIIAHSIGW